MRRYRSFLIYVKDFQIILMNPMRRMSLIIFRRRKPTDFTPKQVVKMMVQNLEDEDPYVFEDPNKTFIDLFMKSGLYITELVKRLFNNPVMKEKIPDNDERMKHILEKQLFGLAPSDIIYHIATNYIFSFDTENRINREHFKSVDTRLAVKEESLTSFWLQHLMN